MIVVDDYIINANTSVILNKYDETGALCSLVLDGSHIYKVRKSPLSIIENSIGYYGNSLQGAIKGALNALGNIQMPPVMISSKLGIYWFPSKSITHKDCIWFSLDQIERYEVYCSKFLRVKLYDGNSIPVVSSYGKFEKKVNRARQLKDMMEKRTNRTSYLVIKPPFDIICDPVRGHYQVR